MTNRNSKLAVAVLASGNGSNLQALIDAQQEGSLSYEIKVVITDKHGARAVSRARESNIVAYEYAPKDYPSKADYEQQVLNCLNKHNIELVVLAGYMRIVGATLLNAFDGRMINLHPSLLPSFQGIHAPQQAIDAGVKVSGCTIHFVDEGLDTGPIIAQQPVTVTFADNADTLQAKIQKLEHKLIVDVVELIAQGRVKRHGRIIEII
ncbi:phosphoribosylglycinamide formyltransferase [Desulfuribacillus alkaliarsenatis]|uniref:Phosphoribosylglycinamide formyltransferase n=1 Tax=Desulfuribacillus alkaliarsenatis TaxID=766136 RepID=A0A1E5G2J3_9FIRM|nr:phosphoribosylglycinamide formyltransferase [Desulfuribacillus alkaliarsenatis]